MSMNKFIVLVLLLVFADSFGQDKGEDQTQVLIARFEQEMREDSITSYFILKKIRYGTVRLIDLGDPNSCRTNEYYFSMYGFWKNGNDTWIKKYDNCGAYNALKLPDSKPMDFFQANLDQLKNQEVKRYNTRTDSSGNSDSYLPFVWQSHSPLRFYWFNHGMTRFDKNFATFNLSTNSESVNVNYEYNNSLALVTLNALCEDLISGLNKQQLFNRIN